MSIEIDVLELSVSKVNLNYAKVFNSYYYSDLDYNYFKTNFYNNNKLTIPDNSFNIIENFKINDSSLNILDIVIKSYEEDVSQNISNWNPINKMHLINDLVNINKITDIENNNSLNKLYLEKLVNNLKNKNNDLTYIYFNIPIYIVSNTKEAKDVLINLRYKITNI